MRDLLLVALFLVVLLAVYLLATTYLHDHHARWLAEQDQRWSTYSASLLDRMRASNLRPSPELTDDELRAMVGHRHAKRFRRR